MGQLSVVIHPDEVEIQPDASRLYFFDANVWLEVLSFSPNLNDPYLKLWRRLSERGIPCVVVNPVLVSEVFNAFLRIRYKRWARLPDTEATLLREGKRLKGDLIDYKKHYRPTQEHQELVEYLLGEFSAYDSYLLTYPEPDRDLDRVVLPRMLANLKSDADFNDRYYTEFCRERNLIMVTHDGDFFVSGLEVVTANPALLAQYGTGRKSGSRR